MDLAQFDLVEAAEKGIVVELIHPVSKELLEDEDGKPVTIKVLGKDSRKWQQVAKRVLARAAAKYRGKDTPVGETEKGLREILAECTLSWTNIEYNDSPLKCNKENALMLYEKRGWIAEQVMEHASDRSYLEK